MVKRLLETFDPWGAVSTANEKNLAFLVFLQLFVWRDGITLSICQ